MSSRTDKWSSDPNAIEERKVKLYSCAEICVSVVREHNLTARLERPDANADFVVLVVSATKAQFRAARIEWLRRMMVDTPATIYTEHESEEEAEKAANQEVDLLL